MNMMVLPIDYKHIIYIIGCINIFIRLEKACLIIIIYLSNVIIL